MMTVDKAIATLQSGGSLPDLAEAIGIVVSSPRSSLWTIALGLKYGGVIAEQAALCLYQRTGTPLPADRSAMRTALADWLDALSRDSDNRRHATVAQFMMEDLSCEERLVVMLHYYEALGFEEISRLLNLPVTRVCDLHSSALARIRVGFAPDVAPMRRLIADLVA